MAITLRRQISEGEKAVVLQQHGRRCFATGHEIPADESVQFDHIRAYATGGASETDNIAPMCGTHNKEKGTLPLGDFRVKLEIRDFFEQGDKLTLRHLLNYFKSQGRASSFAEPVSVEIAGSTVKVESPHRKYAAPLQECPTTGWRYFYATLDVDVLDSDDDEEHQAGLQPRYLILDKVFELYRHFQQHPVLQPSIGRVVGSRVRLFDGQHKVAALLWNNRSRFECKIYLDPDIRLLNQTNISAHDKFAQTRFFSSIMILKLGTQFGTDFEAYKSIEDGQPKTESRFLTYLRNKDSSTLTTAQINERFRSYLYSSVLEHEDNRLKALVSSGNRSTDDQPLTMDMLTKSLFSCFLLREPTDDNMASEHYLREQEAANVVMLMNALFDLGFHAWNPKATSSTGQIALGRLARSKSMMAWSEIVRDAILAKIDLIDESDRAQPLYRELSKDQRDRILGVVRRLLEWKGWSAPTGTEIDRVLADNKSEVKSWLKGQGLSTGYLMGASE